MVEDVAVDFAERSRPAAESVDLDRRLSLHGPENAVQVVHQRLRDIVAGEPGEMILIAELKLDFVQFRIAFDRDDRGRGATFPGWPRCRRWRRREFV